MIISGWLSRWLRHLKYTPVVGESGSSGGTGGGGSGVAEWREWMETHTGATWSGCFSSRPFLVVVLLANVAALSFVSSTHLVFSPESVTKWSCAEEAHSGLTALCKHFEVNKEKRSGVCSMDRGIDFEWNYNFTASPILEYGSYCPLQRIVEPTLVNYLGLFCGSLIGGIFIDTLGRKNVTLICLFFSFLTAMSYYISSNMIMYTYQEFIKGIFNSAALMALLVWLVELSPRAHCAGLAALFLGAASLGSLVTVGLTYLTMEWRSAALYLALAGCAIAPTLSLVPESVRYLIAKGKVKALPECGVKFGQGAVVRPRAKDCLARPQTNRLYAINAAFLLLLGFVQRLLVVLLSSQLGEQAVFCRASVVQGLALAGALLAAGLTVLPVLFYVANVFCVLLAGILLIIASTSISPNILLDPSHPWTLTRVLTGTALMLCSVCVALTYTTIKQVPTLNRGFYVTGINAAYVLGSLFHLITESWCLEKSNERREYCQEGAKMERWRLLVGGVIFLVSLAPALATTCIIQNISLPHSYADLERRSGVEGATGNGHTSPTPPNGVDPTSVISEL